jgi:hypothetical protein
MATYLVLVHFLSPLYLFLVWFFSFCRGGRVSVLNISVRTLALALDLPCLLTLAFRLTRTLRQCLTCTDHRGRASVVIFLAL